MEKVDRRVCLDTNIAIEILKKSERVIGLREKFSDYEIFITTITQFELLLRKTNINEAKIFIKLRYLLHIPQFYLLMI